jgi:tetratricopeptide (TPR) repeat protein
VARADRYFSACLVDEYEHARLNVVRALVLRANEDLANAVAAARMSAESFQRFEDLSRIAAARLAEAQLLFTRREFDVAAALLIDLERRLRDSDDVDTHARVLVNLGYCSWQLGRLDDSLRYHDTAAVLFDELGVYTESIRIRWNVAAILQSSGRTEEAFSRFLSLRKTFLDLGMTSEAALVGLDLSELLLARGDFEAVEEICHTAMRAFETARISYTARALTALAYIHEAARFRTATPKLAKHVRQYLKKLPEDANVLFAPPAP